MTDDFDKLLADLYDPVVRVVVLKRRRTYPLFRLPPGHVLPGWEARRRRLKAQRPPAGGPCQPKE